MKNLSLVLLIIFAACAPRDPEVARWEQRADNVTIIRDTWGIPHIYGETDADVVFGMIYAQCEDDFPRVELNYINAMGRLAEAIDSFRQAIRLRPEYARTYYLLGKIYHTIGETSRATQAFQRYEELARREGASL